MIDPRSIVGAYLTRRILSDAVTVTQTVMDGKRATRVTVHDERIPRPGGGREARWRVTSEQEINLGAREFGLFAAQRVNQASDERGRSIYCWDLMRSDVVAAMRYHVTDLTSPLLLLAVAVRRDAGEDSPLYRESVAAATLLKEYVHEVARKMKKVAADEAKRIWVPQPGDDAVYFRARTGSDDERLCLRALGFRGTKSGPRSRSTNRKTYVRQVSLVA